ncbi:SAVED domain-containing protein [Mesorhizobium sp.]|uniref:SAVED domain-containing protein n=1 Tax=Mesorhizobium sp. TaxID=1871066 RepID=UPI000FE5C0BC|nr:SAVED domain-containing protein [Mesorhizobium sp.]RWD79109.1 MAG: SAVED domain-containing protein [Mesorhizobium sp.]
MADAVVARQQGDDFQARLFWLNAALLLDENAPVRRVSFETGPKAFDDVVVEYAAKGAPQDHTGRPILRDHLQCKWHVRPGDFGYEQFVDPEFTKGTSVSILKRVRDAQVAHAPDGEGARFQLVTNWTAKDPLRKLILNQTNSLDLDALFKGGPQSTMGKLRAAWAEHLAIDEDELRKVARTLGINLRIRSGADLRDHLNDRLARVGMKPVAVSEPGFSYDDLIRKLHAQGRKEFDRNSFRDLAKEANLLIGRGESAGATIGIKSFMHPIDNIEARTDESLNLVPFFEGRYLRDESGWNSAVYPALRDFVLEHARKNDSLRVVLDAHVSLSYAIGAMLDVKSGKSLQIEQRTDGRRFWSRDDVPPDASWPTLDIAVETLGPGPERAIAVGLTHDLAGDVRKYVVANLPQVGALTIARLNASASQSSVKSGAHAAALAEALAAHARAQGRFPCTHIFVSAPNGFTFFLGQLHQTIGASTVYEWDFDGRRTGSYSEGLQVG